MADPGQPMEPVAEFREEAIDAQVFEDLRRPSLRVEVERVDLNPQFRRDEVAQAARIAVRSSKTWK